MSDVGRLFAKLGILIILVGGALLSTPQRAAADELCCLNCARQYNTCLQSCPPDEAGCMDACLDAEQSCKSSCGVSPC